MHKIFKRSLKTCWHLGMASFDDGISMGCIPIVQISCTKKTKMDHDLALK